MSKSVLSIAVISLALLAACTQERPAQQNTQQQQQPADATGAAKTPDAGATHQVEMRNARGESVGSATLQTAGQGVTIALNLRNLPPGEHAFHIHENPRCEADPKSPSTEHFKSAGAHLNPGGNQHGLNNKEKGPHAGDMENITVAKDGTFSGTVTNTRVSLDPNAPNSVFAKGGTSLMVHAKPDDMKTDPSGAAGDRIACGVVMRDGQTGGASATPAQTPGL